ncbi:hypothetical protein [Pseudoalteromonas sp. SR44-2]|uniref:hypothetical protein n=1 Tax=Pseudoalteromonas sp. SR44-2 TaxID=2760937 RepID=UPI001600D0D7|nr:hypothetical protein [Pseudoalteromonas sp. SR44-2]MBB1339428.1 hypothetical protein [Pseudoalteromonas sp. SR44-2]
MKTKQDIAFCWKKTGLAVLISLTAACSGDNKTQQEDDYALIILEDGQTVDDVINKNENDSDDEANTDDIPITSNPESEGQPLFINPENSEQALSGFEFCCGGNNTFQIHGFEQLTGDFSKFDGGFWAADISGHLGERVFSSFADGFDLEGEALGQLGFAATGSMLSPKFTIQANYINFLIGGGNNGVTDANTTAIALLIDNKIVRQASGTNAAMQVDWQTWDVSEFSSQEAQIKFIDHHSDDNSDTDLPYLLVDEIRQADSAAKVPSQNSKLIKAIQTTTAPASTGQTAFSRVSNAEQNIAGFEFCCGKFNTYANHDFRATGDMAKLDGGWWAADITNHVGERIFSSRADGFLADGTQLGWIGNEATGTLSSPPFTITHSYINFLIGGGTNPFDSEKATAIVLRINGKIVRHAIGNGLSDKLDWFTWDVNSLIGETAVIEIIDQDNTADEAALAFIMADEFKLSDYAAVEPLSESIVTQLNQHSIPLPLTMADPNPVFLNGEFYIYYLIDTAFHDWYLTRTTDLINGTFPQRVLEATGDAQTQDQWTGSGSVIKDNDNMAHLFYSGHNLDFSPVEAVMHATATDNTLTKWEKQVNNTFSGTGSYSDFDFRDPEVFYNEQTNNYWMLLTSRYNEDAAIALYTSSDLKTWQAQQPIYTADKPLNFEVPDWVSFNNGQAIIYSDQNDHERDVKYLVKNEDSWIPGKYPSLDGEFYYAGRAASSPTQTLMFGWVAHKNTRSNIGRADFGGDLAIHQISMTESGELAVSIPEQYLSALATPVDEDTQTQSAQTNNDNSLLVSPGDQVLLGSNNKINRLHFNISSDDTDNRFALVFPAYEESTQTASIEINTATETATFYFGDSLSQSSSNVTLTPELEGEPLFRREEDLTQHIAGFEFCCGGYNTLAAHGFTNLTGDFSKLDGGWWGGDVSNNVGERVFSSFADGFDEDGTALGWIGNSATGTMDSPSFVISQQYINFKIGGGSNQFDHPKATAVVLVVDGQIVRSQSGKDTQPDENNKLSIQWATWDVEEFIGKTAFIQFIDLHNDDGSDNSLAYLLADEFRAAALPAVVGEQSAPTSESRMDSQVVVPIDLKQGITVDLLLQPESGFGTAYINDFRALSFRLYDLDKRQVGIYSKQGTLNISEMTRFTEATKP